MTEEQKQRWAADLAKWCDARIDDSEIGPLWQSKFREIGWCLRALCNRETAMERAARSAGTGQ